MGALSNQMLAIAILGYLAAMVCYAAEYAFGTRGAVARAAQRELVGAGGPPSPPGPADVPSTPTRPLKLGAAAVWLTGLAGVLHLVTLVSRGFAAGRVPWGNMYEFVLAGTLAGTVAWLVLLARRPEVRPLGLYVALVQVVLLGLAGMALYTPAGPLVPALNSYWLKIHVSAAAAASGILLVGFIAAVMHLIRSGYDKGRRSFPYTLGERLPLAESLERLSFRVHAFAFPIWTFAIICGAIWAEAAWGRFWGWDAKEVWSFISWVAYAAYLHARATPSVSRTVTSWLAVGAWATMLFNLVGVNLFVAGLHSYAGV